MNYCPKCGSEVGESDTLCSSCGRELGETTKKELPKKELLEELPSFHDVFGSGVTAGVVLMSGIIITALYFFLMKIENMLKAEFGPFEVGVAFPDYGWILIVGFLALVAGVIGLIWGYSHYKFEYEKLKGHVEE